MTEGKVASPSSTDSRKLSDPACVAPSALTATIGAYKKLWKRLEMVLLLYLGIPLAWLGIRVLVECLQIVL